MIDWYWVLTGAVLLCFWIFNSILKFHRQLNKQNSRVPDIEILKKIVPPRWNNGWTISTVTNATPIWRYSTTFTFAPKNLITSCVVLPVSSQRLLEELKNINIFSLIFPDIAKLKCISYSDNTENHDRLSISNMYAHLTFFNLLLSNQQAELIFERYWHSESNMSWLYVFPTMQLLTSMYGYWICFLMRDTVNENGSILHILTSYPSTISSAKINQMISSFSVLLKAHFELLRNLPSAESPDSDVQKKKTKMTSRRSSPRLVSSSPNSSPIQVRSSASSSPVSSKLSSMSKQAYGQVEEPAVIGRFAETESLHSQENHSLSSNTEQLTGNQLSEDQGIKSALSATNASNKSTSAVSPASSSTTSVIQVSPSQGKAENSKVEHSVCKTEVKQDEYVVNEKLIPYLDLIKDGYEMLLSIYRADENTPGWEIFNVKDGVTVHKKVADEIFINGCFKGTTSINVPFPYVATYVLDMSYKKEYDGVFESGSDLEVLGDGVTKIINLVYQNIWPTTGRDFCSISAPRHIKDNLYGIMVKAVSNYDGCPLRKNKVRGEVIIGGYIFEEVSVDPPITNITYATSVDLKGFIPSKIVNKVSSDQPLSVGIIRNKVQERYLKQDPATDGKIWLDKFHSVPSIYPQVKTRQNVDEAEILVKDQIEMNVEPIESTFVEPVAEINIETVSECSKMNKRKIDSNVTIENKLNVNDCNEGNDVSLSKGDPLNLDTSDDSYMDNDHSLNFNLLDSASKMANLHTGHMKSSGNGVVNRENVIDKENVSPMDEGSGTLLTSGFDLKNNHYSYADGTLELPSIPSSGSSELDDADSISESLQLTDEASSQNQLSIAEQELDLPRDSHGRVDFVTLGNQSAAALEEEFFIARKVDTSVKSDISRQEPDVWKYQGTSKNVIMMRKISSVQKIHSFLGRGIIKVLPAAVWNIVKTPTTRFVYDNMLKKISVVKEVNEKSKIVHMRHETHACFVKQARDFCVLTVERDQQQRYIVAGTSVDVPECPPENDCVRGKVYSSGWVIEPITHNGKPCSLVTYISQINFGGRLPTRLINFIAKRQPLAVAYLRNYLETV